jgi:hypothetical protein
MTVSPVRAILEEDPRWAEAVEAVLEAGAEESFTADELDIEPGLLGELVSRGYRRPIG